MFKYMIISINICLLVSQMWRHYLETLWWAWIEVGEAPIYVEKGVAAPAPETNQKWLERTREGGPTYLRQLAL